MDEQLKVSFTGDASGLEKASQDAASSLSKIEKSAGQTTVALSNIPKVSAQVSSASATLARNAAAAGGAAVKSTRDFTGLSRVIQDLPYGFNAISNNLTQLLPAAGAAGLAFSAIVSAITLAQIGFGAWTRGMGKVNEANDKAKKKLEETKERIAELTKSFSSIKIDINAEVAGDTAGEITKVQALSKVVQDVTKSYNERNNALNQLKEINKNYFGDLTLESDKLSTLTGRVEEYTKALVAASVVKAFSDDIGKVGKELSQQGAVLSDLENQLNAIAGDYQLVGKKQEGFKLLTPEQSRQAEKLKGQISEQEALVNSLGNTYKKLEQQINSAVLETLKFKPLDVASDSKKTVKSSFLFDFLPFNPDGKLSPEQRRQLLDAIDKFQKDFGKILQGAIFTGDTEERIKQAKKFDLELKAGKIKFDTSSFRENINSNPDLDAMSGLVVDQFIKSFQNESDRLKNLDSFNLSSLFNFNTDLSAQLDLFKTRLKQLGAAIPETIEATNIFGKPVQITFDELFDTSKIANNDAIDALRKSFDKIKSQTVDFGKEIDQILRDVAVQGFSSFGEAFGTALAGGDLENVFQSLFSFIGDAISGLGKQMIALSPVIAALKVGIRSLNPAILLPAGIGLVAIGTLLKNIHPKGFAKGGWVPGQGSGDTVPAMLTPGEFVVTKDKAPFVASLLKAIGSGLKLPKMSDGVFKFADGGLVPSVQRSPLRQINNIIQPGPNTIAMPQGDWRIRGKDLVFVMAQTQQSQTRAT